MRQAAELSLQLASIPLQLHSSIARTLTGKYGVTVREDNPVAERHLGLEASGELAALISMTCDLITVGLLLAGRLRRSSEEKTPNSEASADRFNEELAGC